MGINDGRSYFGNDRFYALRDLQETYCQTDYPGNLLNAGSRRALLQHICLPQPLLAIRSSITGVFAVCQYENGDTISRVFMLTERSSHTQKLIVRMSSDYEYCMFPV